MGKTRKKKPYGSAARTAVDSRTAVSVQESKPPPNFGGRDSLKVDMKSGLLEGLTSLNAPTRESSCATIASLFEKIDAPEAENGSWSAAQRLIAGGLIKKLLPRMLDRVPEVKLQAIGAIRNISAVRDPRLCEIMIQDDCLTPVLTLLHRMATSPVVATTEAPAAGNDASASTSQTRVKTSAGGGSGVMTPQQDTAIMAQLAATLCNLLAAVDVAVARFTKQGGLPVVMELFQGQGCRGNAEIFGCALQALHTSTDSNAELAAQLAALPEVVGQITALVGGAEVPHVNVSASMRVQAAGVLVNVAGLAGNAAQSSSAQAELSRAVLPLLLAQMEYDPSALHRACVVLANPSTKAPARDEGEMDVEGKGGSFDGDDIGEDNAADMEKTAAGPRVAAAVAATMPMEVATREVLNSEEVTRAEGASCEGGPPGGEEKEGSHTERAPGQSDVDAEIRWEWKLGVAEPLKLAAEVLTNLCALAAAEEDEQEEHEWGSDDEAAMEHQAESVGSGGVIQQQVSTNYAGGSTPTVLLDAMVEFGALQRVIATLKAILSPTPRDRQQGGGALVAAEPATDMETKKLSPHTKRTDGDRSLSLPLPSGTAGDLADLRATVALCAANLVQNLPLRALGANPNALWTELCSMCKTAAERAPSCVEALTGVMWGLVRRAGPAIAAGIGPATPAMVSTGTTGLVDDPLSLLLRLCDPDKTRAFEARVNAVGMLGTLGAEVSKLRWDVGDLELGRALVRAMEDPHVLVQAEALNAVMDLYGDDDHNAAFWASGAPDALKGGVPAFKRKVKQEGKALGRDALLHLKETALNAARFVKYKAVHGGVGVGAGAR